MISLSKSGSTVTFTFDDNSGYLQNGTIEVPVNSLSLVIDESNMVTFKKSASNDVFVSANIAEFGMSKSELESWYKDNMVGSTGGGGATYTAGRGIDIDSGNTISFTLPISAGTGNNSIAEGNGTTASGKYSHAEGRDTVVTSNTSHAEGNATSATSTSSHAEGSTTLASGNYSHAEGKDTVASGATSHAEGISTIAGGSTSHAEGSNTITNNSCEHASGRWNVSSSASTTFGNSGNTLFSVGNGSHNARHNAFEIRQNGDIYLSSGGNDVKLQDYLATPASSAITSGDTNAVAGGAVYNKFDEIEQVTARALVDVNAKFGGLKLQQISQADYDALVSGGTVDNSTLYIITNVVN